ncbi:3-deoxy-manno-octulosonate cytidylyltransferase [Vibrio nitrifigilis]|uniref:3-deoxy-manno-octulosonate cytidylyltransferase n=1 Tax=Vibrio nitrifigilis TaxID=2789781 RepID=A0ABS0GG50_9VIBR|nr:3-deoxy-manno-octulosonate cytidylyltransferase [Vibrio nitrifigilis]MBF9001193.1 3-deoxy-manno-octulosonate cytidylyltransferase [Vibrio nitrifigilis]
MAFENIKIVIPSRYGSSRLPGKPLMPLCEKPMFWHVVNQAVTAGFSIQDIVVATDDQRIMDAAQQYIIPAVLTDKNHASGTDRLYEVCEKLGWGDDTLVINVQGDEPMIPPALITTLANFATQSPQFDICTVMSPILSVADLHNPNVVKVAEGEGQRAVYFSRSPIPFDRESKDSLASVCRHIGIYAYRVERLRQFCSFPESSLEKIEKLEQLRALSHGMSIGVVRYNEAPPHGIDTQEDYDDVKHIMENS